MKIVCDACAAKYSIADEKVAGKVFKIRCKKCSNIIVVRGVKEEADAGGEFGHDEKETRVFDYSGYDDPQAAVAAGEVDGAVWHLVIDQEQVGPMTADEVRARFAAGEIEVDSFVWREGFDDWERLDALSEFADLAPEAAATGDEAGAAMFGGPALEDPLADDGDPADLFTAQATGQAPPVEDTGGLFGDVGADDGGLFGSEPMAAAAAAEPEPVDERLTGQRNENSVLFSLNNLASLASDSPKPAASSSSSSSSASSPAGQTTAAQDGSGLIDIRAMASMYMGDSGDASPAASSGGSIDDLPVFSQPSIAAASPVLMPVAAPANTNKVLVALIAGIGALVLVAVILLVLVLRGGDDKSQVAANQSGNDSANTANTADNTDKTAPDTPATGDGDGDSDNAGKTVDGDGDTTADNSATPETDKPETDKPAAGRTEKPDKPERKETAREKRARLKQEKEERERKERERKDKETKTADTSSKGGCDEITCLVDSSKACCRKGGSKPTSSGGGDDLPDRPTKSQVQSGMGRVSGAAKGCGKRNGWSGKVRVRIRISGSGRVSSASASGGPGGVNSCVSSAVKRARFPKTKNGLSFTYGYSL